MFKIFAYNKNSYKVTVIKDYNKTKDKLFSMQPRLMLDSSKTTDSLHLEIGDNREI